MNRLDAIEYKDLEQEYQALADVIGFDSFVNLIRNYGGTNVYVPKPDWLGRDARNASIRAEFTGYNYNQLALKYELTETHIRNIIREGRKK